MTYINEEMENYGKEFSDIRKLFTYGNELKKELGEDNVFDFALGNPKAEVPIEVTNDMVKLLTENNSTDLHGYTESNGDKNVLKLLSEYLSKKYNYCVDSGDLYMTCGAAASLSIVAHALYQEGDEVMLMSPYFPEYIPYFAKAKYKLIEVDPLYDTFEININDINKKISKNTKAIVLNNPNNPTGVVYDRKQLCELADVLASKEKEYGKPIYIISDEPYREIVYEGVNVPFIPSLYDNTIITYSYSKALSLPGDRIGYIQVSNNIEGKTHIMNAIKGAGRCLGYICAPAFMQKVISRNLGVYCDISIYKNNRDLLYNGLANLGYKAVYPRGAFYLFIKSLEKDARAFCENAKKFNILIAPSDGFNCKGYARVSYCVKSEMIIKSLEGFKKLKQLYDER